MQHHRLLVCAAVLLTLTLGRAAAQQPPLPIQQPPQPPAGQPAQQPFVFVPPQSRVAPGLPTVELAPLLQRVSRASNKRFIVDGRVPPQIYLAGVDAGELTYPVLLSVLRANGFAAYESEGRVNIVPEAEIRSAPLRMVQTDDASIAADEYVTRVLTVTNVEAPPLIPVLRPLLPVTAHLAGFMPNKIIIMDRYANVQRITEIIRTLDVPAPRPVQRATP